MIKLGLIQNTATESRHENFDRTCEKIDKAAASGANIIATQELFRSPYFCQKEDHAFFEYAEEVNAETVTVRTLSNIAQNKNVVIIASLFEKRAEGIYHNSAVVIDADGSYLGKYRKMHIPDDPQYYEKFYFTEGDLGYKAFQTAYGTIGVLICWDQWYPEAARLTALSGAQIIFYPTAIGHFPDDTDDVRIKNHSAWETVQRSHAIANGCYVAAINRTGFETDPDNKGGIEFWGQSFVSDPGGEIIAKAPSDTEDILIVEIDLETVNKTRLEWPFFRDRRIESYTDITKRFND